VTTMRWTMASVILVCLAPLLGVLVALGVTKLTGCTVHEGFANPCFVLGLDVGGILYALAVSGWALLATLPLAGILGVAWAVIELVGMASRRKVAAETTPE